MATEQHDVIHIKGMSCGHCVSAVQEALAEMSGVEVLKVEIGRAEVRYDPERTSRHQIEHVIEDAGYDLAG